MSRESPRHPQTMACPPRHADPNAGTANARSPRGGPPPARAVPTSGPTLDAETKHAAPGAIPGATDRPSRTASAGKPARSTARVPSIRRRAAGARAMVRVRTVAAEAGAVRGGAARGATTRGAAAGCATDVLRIGRGGPLPAPGGSTKTRRARRCPRTRARRRSASCRRWTRAAHSATGCWTARTRRRAAGPSRATWGSCTSW